MSRGGAPPTTAPGAAASEVELLREKVRTLVEEAARNEGKLARSLERELSLIRAESLSELFDEATHGLARSFGLARVRLAVEDPNHELRHLGVGANGEVLEFAHVLFTDSLVAIAPLPSQLTRPLLTPYVAADHGLLFDHAADLASVALLPLRRQGRLQGLLCLGSTEADRFTAEMATDILQRLSAVLGVCLENAYNRARAVRSGMADFLTGWHSRRYLHARLREELARAARQATPVSCLMIDVDHFKTINDTYGHLAGDEALREITSRIDTQIRASDTAARFGGDEFSLVLPDTGLAAAVQLAERIRQAMAAPLDLGRGRNLPVSVSVGVATVMPPRGAPDLKALGERLLAGADAALYRAKAGGRDQVESEPLQ